MFNFIRRTFSYLRSSVRTSPSHKRYLLQYHPLSSLSTLESISNSSNQHSFTVSYLISSCGFPPEKALSASKYTKFETPDKPDSVLAFLNSHGFTKTQISSLTRRVPRVLLCDPQKTLLPKLEFLDSIGASSADAAKILSSVPHLFKRSLENQIIPSFNFCKNLLQSHEETIAAIKHSAELLCLDLQNHVEPNVEILREIGVPASNIVVLLTSKPRAFMIDADRFKKIVEEVKEMGFNPLRMKFVVAVRALRSLSKLTWERKVELYKKWGWSEDEIFVAFGKDPGIMMASEDKIMRAMDFFVNKMGLESSVLARRPVLILLSFEKRIVPRCSVYEVLLAKGLIKQNFCFRTLLESPEKLFLEKFVKCYKEEAPELLNLYREKLGLSK